MGGASEPGARVAWRRLALPALSAAAHVVASALDRPTPSHPHALVIFFSSGAVICCYLFPIEIVLLYLFVCFFLLFHRLLLLLLLLLLCPSIRSIHPLLYPSIDPSIH